MRVARYKRFLTHYLFIQWSSIFKSSTQITISFHLRQSKLTKSSLCFKSSFSISISIVFFVLFSIISRIRIWWGSRYSWYVLDLSWWGYTIWNWFWLRRKRWWKYWRWRCNNRSWNWDWDWNWDWSRCYNRSRDWWRRRGRWILSYTDYRLSFNINKNYISSIIKPFIVCLN